jgi:hypothetical protein
MKTEKGVMIIKDNKGWGNAFSSGNETCDGWVDLEDARIHNPEFCTKTTDVAYNNSPYIEELKKGKLVKVIRETTVKIYK